VLHCHSVFHHLCWQLQILRTVPLVFSPVLIGSMFMNIN
jgi:hypothetical protein